MTQLIIPLEKASKMVPLLRKISIDIKDTWTKIKIERLNLQNLSDKNTKNPSIRKKMKKSHEKINHLIANINEYIDEIENLGCFVEEFTRGVINIPSIYNGRKVFLTWCPDDNKICRWMELDSCYDKSHSFVSDELILK